MASKEDLTDQLGITQKLTAAIEQMARAMSHVEESYATQIDAAKKLSAAIDGLKSQDLSSLNNTKLDGLRDSMKESEKGVTTLTGRMKELGNTMAKKVPVGVAVGAAAISGLAQGARNLIALTKGLAGFFTSFVSGAASIAASIIAIPFKIFGGLVAMAADAGGGTNELAIAIENLRKEMGDLKGPGASAVLVTTKTLKGFSDTGLNSYRIFGTLAERLELVTKVATAMGATFGVLRKEFEDNGGALLAYQKGLGLTDEQMKSVGDRSITMGDTMSKTLLDVTKQTLALGKAFDIDQKLIGKDIGKAVADVHHFGAVTVKEIGQASVYARKLGLELDKIVGTLDAFETFDTAAENAAKLSQAFGVNVDAFKLMEAQNPAEQMDMLRKSFRDAGVDASKFSRQQAKLLSQTTGLDEATVRQAFSMKNQGASLDDIKKKSEGASKKTLSQAEAMSKLADSIERMIKSGGGAQAHSFFDQFIKGMLAGFQNSEQFRKTMMEIKVALNQVWMIGFKLGRMLPDLIPGLKDFLGGMTEFFNPKHFTGLFEGISKSATQFLSKNSPDKGSIPKLMENLRTNMKEFFDAEGPNARAMISGFKTILKFLSKTLADGITWLSKQAASGLGTIIDLITGKQKLNTAGAKGGVAGGLGFLKEIFEPIARALKGAYVILEPKIVELLKLVAAKVVKFFSSAEFKGIVHKAMPVIAGVLFGPALGRSLITSLGTTLLKQVFSGGGLKVLEKAASSLTTKLGGSSLGAVAGPAAFVAAAAAIGQGVNTYTSLITANVDHSSKVIAAGATGLVDALTLGLLPKDLSLTIANVLAKVVESMYDGIKKVFGKGFGESMKRNLSSAFEVLGDIFSVVTKLFTGNQADFEAALEELKYSMARLGVSAIEYMGLQFPIMMLKMSTKILASVTNVLVKLVVASLGIVTSGIDKLGLGTNLTAKLDSLSSDLTDNINKNAEAQAKALESAADKISDASESFSNEQLRTQADRAKLARQAANTADSSSADDVKGVAADMNASMQGISENIKTVKDVQAQLADDDFDLPAAIADIKSKLMGVDFDFLSQEQVNSLDSAAKNITKFSEILTGVQESMSSVAAFPEMMRAATAAIKSDALAPAVDAVNKMVQMVKQLDDALADGDLNKLNVVTNLQKVATSLGLGSKANYTIRNKDVQITLNLKVVMEAGELEKVLIERKDSIIRDRLEYGTIGDGAAKPGTPSIPETYQKAAPALITSKG